MRPQAQKMAKNIGTGIMLLLIAFFAAQVRAETRQFMPLAEVKVSKSANFTASSFNLQASQGRYLSLKNTNRPMAAIPLAKAKGFRIDAKLRPKRAAHEVQLASLGTEIPSPSYQPASRPSGNVKLLLDKQKPQAPYGAAFPYKSAKGIIWPVANNYTDISSKFGPRVHPVTHQHSFHEGIDIPAPVGTSVLAALPGEVTDIGSHPRLGNYVKITHQDGTYSLYGHLQRSTVNVGNSIKAGQTIALLGNTGRSTGPHLDFSYHKNGKAIDPLPMLREARALATLADEKKLAKGSKEENGQDS